MSAEPEALADTPTGEVPVSLRDLAYAAWREADRLDDAAWHNATPEERAAIIAGRIITTAGAVESLARAGYTGPNALARYLADSMAIHSDTGDVPTAGMNARTARELFAAVPEATVWRLSDLIPDGAITELDGRAKAAGKTTFVAHLMRAVLDGAPFLGRATRQGPVVMLSEQPVASLRASLASAGLLERDDLWLLTWGEAIGRPWPEVAELAIALCRREAAGLLVVDTLPQWAGLRGDLENAAGAALEALEPLQRATGDGLAVLVVRHDRKGSGEVGESARGSSAFGGAVDVILHLRRGNPDERPTIRYLSALSRFPETPGELVVELTPAGYVAIGDAEGYARGEGKARILSAIGSGELRRADIEEASGVKGERLTDLLAELVAGGFLAREGRGVKGDPQRYRRTVSIHSGTPPHYVGGAVPNEIDPDAVGTEPDYIADAMGIFGDVLADGAGVVA